MPYVSPGLLSPIDYWPKRRNTMAFLRTIALPQRRGIAARNTAMPLVFARLIGRNTCDINAVAIARATFGPGWGFTGLNAITIKNNTFFMSYNSSIDPTPGFGTVYFNALIGSNGPI